MLWKKTQPFFLTADNAATMRVALVAPKRAGKKPVHSKGCHENVRKGARRHDQREDDEEGSASEKSNSRSSSDKAIYALVDSQVATCKAKGSGCTPRWRASRRWIRLANRVSSTCSAAVRFEAGIDLARSFTSKDRPSAEGRPDEAGEASSTAPG